MKLKVAASSNLTPAHIEAINSRTSARHFLSRVAIQSLHVSPLQITPGGHFQQETDLTIPVQEGCKGINFALTMVSRNEWNRSTKDFYAAMDRLLEFYEALAHKHEKPGDPFHLLGAMALDEETTLLPEEGARKTRLLDHRWEKWIIIGQPGVKVENPPVYDYRPDEVFV